MTPAVLASLRTVDIASGPTAADWLSAAGTIFAAVIALGVALLSGLFRMQDLQRLGAEQADERARREEAEQRRDEERRDLEAAQARTVLLSVEDNKLIVTNHSAAPILDVKVSEPRLITPNGDSWVAATWHAQRGRPLPPGGRWLVALPGNKFSPRDGDYPPTQFRGPETGDYVEVTYEFIDSRGLSWSRKGNGAPQRVTWRSSWGPEPGLLPTIGERKL